MTTRPSEAFPVKARTPNPENTIRISDARQCCRNFTEPKETQAACQQKTVRQSQFPVICRNAIEFPVEAEVFQVIRSLQSFKRGKPEEPP